MISTAFLWWSCLPYKYDKNSSFIFTNVSVYVELKSHLLICMYFLFYFILNCIIYLAVWRLLFVQQSTRLWWPAYLFQWLFLYCSQWLYCEPEPAVWAARSGNYFVGS